MTESQDNMIPQPDPGAWGRPPRPPKMTGRGLAEDVPSEEPILDEIQRRLARYPDAYVIRGASSIRFLPSDPDGFVVCLNVHQKKGVQSYTICYNGSHEKFTHRKSAVNAFGFGLSNGCRLKEYSKRGKTYRWIVEMWSVQRSRWEPDWDVVDWSAALRRWYCKPAIRYLHNWLIDLDSEDLRWAA